MGQFADDFVSVARRAAPAQAGLFSGDNPSVYNMNDPIQLWVIQVIIIILFTQLLGLLLGRIRQPKVIAEVIGGVILGPSIMGRIPNFTNTIFPAASWPMLTLTSTIGLVFFLFLVGLEIDTRIMKRNVKAALAISLAGLIIPLGLGAALGVGVYREFSDPKVNFGYFVLFVAVAIGITAFPVLCRILTELKLLDTTVGVVVLSAGVGNDVVGWILLALAVALANASTGLVALYVLLTGAGYALFLLFPVKWCYVWLARRTGSFERGSPTSLMMTVTIIMVLFSALFTDIIGIHPIFGGFLAGLVIPHENGYSIALVEKIEDLIGILFLPLYFTLSGLRTNLGLLDNGITWGYVVLICTVAFFAKFLPCFTAAKVFGFTLRESTAIGALMSCKGLVELIVLNVGLQAGILDTRTFSMFVIHAIILTFMTTPLTLLAYPESVRVHAGVVKERIGGGGDIVVSRRSGSDDELKTRFAVILDRIEQLPAAMTLTQLLQNPHVSSGTVRSSASSSIDEKAAGDVAPIPTLTDVKGTTTPRNITVDALRLIELTDRTSAVLKSQAAESIIHSDPVVSVFRTFGYLNRMAISAALNVVPQSDFTTSIDKHVREYDSQMVILPWSRGDRVGTPDESSTSTAQNPFDGNFQVSSVIYSNFIRKVFQEAPADVALFVDRGIPSSTASSDQHLFLPFFGGPDDRLALSFVVQLCANPAVSATVVKFKKTEVLAPTTTVDTIEEIKASAHAATSPTHNTLTFADTVYGHGNTQTRLESDTADSLVWDRYSKSSSSHSPAVVSALGRIRFSEQSSAKPLQAIADLAASEAQLVTGRTLVAVIGRSRRLAPESHSVELREILAEKALTDSVSRTLGDVGAALVAKSTNASLLVMQAWLS